MSVAPARGDVAYVKHANSYSATSGKGLLQHKTRWHEGTYACTGTCGHTTCFATNADFIKHSAAPGARSRTASSSMCCDGRRVVD